MPAVRPSRAASPDADDTPPILRLLDAAEEAGELDVRQVAEALGLGVSALRSALARPGALDRAQRAVLAGALGVDRTTLRTLLGPEDAAEARESTASAASDDPELAAGERTSPSPTGAAAVADALPPPRSAAEVVERAVLAIDDAQPWGRTVRLAVVDAAERGAREAGRAVPRELHALRARVRAGTRALDSSQAPAGIVDTAPPTRPRHGLPPEDARVLDAATAIIRDLQRTGAGYDDLFAPLHDDAVTALLRRFMLVTHEVPLGATSAVVVTPALYGRAVVVLSSAATADQRRVALRLALAHAAGDHVREERPLRFPAPPHEARVAALVALADLLPFWQLSHGRGRARLGWAALTDDVARQAAMLAGDWTEAQVRDAATLRVALFRNHGL
jgi:hypothetical protein